MLVAPIGLPTVAAGDLAMLHVGIQTSSQVTMIQYGFAAIVGAAGWQQVLVDDWFTSILPTFRSLLSQNTTVRDLTVHDIVPGTAEDASHLIPTPLPGLVVGGPLPPQVAVICQHLSGVAGRSNRGRVFIPGAPLTAKSAAGINVVSAYRVLQASYLSVVMARYGPTGTSTVARAVTISRQEDGVVRPTPVGVPITSMVAGFSIATQRRRNNRF